MADSRESQRSLLFETELATARPQRAWNPLGRSSPDSHYGYFPSFTQESFSEDALRDVGLGISSTSTETLTGRDKRESVSVISPLDTPRYLKTPQETPILTHNHGNCPTRSTILQSRLSWVPMTVLVLSFYATLFSGLYLAVAFWKPRWTFVGGGGSVSPSTANLLCAFFAKTIELAYVTICVAFLGQVLSRRALMKDSRGISLADMSMRAWIMQPGSMIVHWETLRFSALTFLGVIALIATIVGMLYTTAAEALGEFDIRNLYLFTDLAIVSPKLSMGPMVSTTLWGKVYASWANPEYVANNCKSPIPLSMDPVYRNTTCLEMEHVGQAYHNFDQWLMTWNNIAETNQNSSIHLQLRPQPTAAIWDNTTVTGSWIEIHNITALSTQHGRMVNNITMALPHSGVPIASIDPRNKIRLPQDASGEDKFSIEASVPSPAVNVLCVGMTKTELEPLVYSSWPNANFDPTTWSQSPSPDIPSYPSWLNRTVVDSIFSFGPTHGQRPPIFGTFPEANNTILNITGRWPSNSIYLLGKPSLPHPPYVMCAIRGKETGVCSTRYQAASSGTFLTTNCENSTNPLQYNLRDTSFTEGLWSADWKNIAGEWANAVSLGAGITSSQASTERLLMQMMPSYNPTLGTYALNPSLPSIGEALAVLSGCTLILSSQNAPFTAGWNYTSPPDILPAPVYEAFPATLQAASFVSGGTEQWQGIFYIILTFAFLTSIICLCFMLIEARGQHITDFTEPVNLFALAVNSPSSSRLDGACGGGPVGRQLGERWFIGMEESEAHYYIRAKVEGESPFLSGGGREGHAHGNGNGGRFGFGNGNHGRGNGYRRLEEMEVEEERVKPVSPAVEEFRRVSHRGSWLTRFY